MDRKMRDKIKTILQECYNVDLADERSREYVADMITVNLSDEKDNELHLKRYGGVSGRKQDDPTVSSGFLVTKIKKRKKQYLSPFLLLILLIF